MPNPPKVAPSSLPVRGRAWPTFAALWAVVAVLVVGSNLLSGSGNLGLDGDVLQYDRQGSITVSVRDLGPARATSAAADGEGGAVYHRTAGKFAEASDKRTFYALFIAQLFTVVGGAFCVERLVRRAARRQPFSDRNVLWLRLLALSVALGGIAIPVLAHRWEDAIIDDFTQDMEIVHAFERMSSGPGQGTFAVVAVLLLLSEVWKRGIALRRDVEATI